MEEVTGDWRREEVRGDWRKLHNVELYTFHSSHFIFTVIKRG
jgi:hypothetical protein